MAAPYSQKAISTLGKTAAGDSINAVQIYGSSAGSTFNSGTAAYTATAATATPTPMATQTGGKGVYVVINVTAGTTLALTVSIQGKDPVTATWTTVLVSASITGVGATVMEVYPGITPATNLAAAYRLPTSWRVIVTHGNANAATYTVGIDVLD